MRLVLLNECSTYTTDSSSDNISPFGLQLVSGIGQDELFGYEPYLYEIWYEKGSSAVRSVIKLGHAYPQHYRERIFGVKLIHSCAVTIYCNSDFNIYVTSEEKLSNAALIKA